MPVSGPAPAPDPAPDPGGREGRDDGGDLSRPRPPAGLYVHFPFCVSLCPYCDFVVVSGAAARGPKRRIEALLEAVHRELDLRVDAVTAAFGARLAPLQSVYLGGGTPSLMRAAQVGRLLDHVRSGLGIAADAEVTLEANPGADEIGDLAGFREAGVSRISIGAQSMDDAELGRLGRRHRRADVVAAVGRARAAAIGSISLDLLTDVPGQSLESWQATLEAVLALAPDHLSAYTLTLDDPDAEGLTGLDGDHLPVSRGARAWRQRALREQSDERAAAMELLTDELVTAAGMQRYEVANMARPGAESRHNLLYWRRLPYLALGPGAHASDGGLRRSWNAARLDRYIEALEAGQLPPGGSETIDTPTALAEQAILGLRLTVGIDETLAEQPGLVSALEWARANGLAEDEAGRTRLTQQGRLLANEVFSRLLPDPSVTPASSAADA